MEPAKKMTKRGVREYAIFNVGDIACGIDIDIVREINRNIKVTPVHLAPDYVRGVINLRGQIVTVIDVRNKFGLETLELHKDMRVLVVRCEDEDKGLLVDGVDDISAASEDMLEPSPSHISESVRKYLSGVYKRDDELVALLDVEKLLKKEEDA